MALIECPECTKLISDKAIACPSCGYPLRENRRQAFPFLPPLSELAGMAGEFAGMVREALHPENRQGESAKTEKKPEGAGPVRPERLPIRKLLGRGFPDGPEEGPPVPLTRTAIAEIPMRRHAAAVRDWVGGPAPGSGPGARPGTGGDRRADNKSPAPRSGPSTSCQHLQHPGRSAQASGETVPETAPKPQVRFQQGSSPAAAPRPRQDRRRGSGEKPGGHCHRQRSAARSRYPASTKSGGRTGSAAQGK